MKFHTNLILVSIISILALSSCDQFRAFGANNTDAVTAIAAADERIVVCYNAVREADAAGANVLDLVATLNEAGIFLSKAELSYEKGDFDSAVSDATQSQAILNDFVDIAKALTETALNEKHIDFLVLVGGSLAAVAAVICGSFAVWHLYKKDRKGGS